MEGEKIYSVDELEIKQHSMVLITSKRASGKSVLVRNLIKNLMDKYEYQFIVLFSDTAKFNEDYNFIEDHYIFTTDQIENKLDKILKIQEKNVKNKKLINGLIILDDVKIHSKSKKLIDLASMGRHFKLTCIISSQFPKQLITSSIRNNIDYYLWSDLGEIALKAIYDSIHIPLNFRKFDEYVNQNNHNYQFIMYDSRVQDKKERLKVIKGKEYNNLKFI